MTGGARVSETRELAKWAHDLQYADLPAPTVVKTKQCLLEFLSCCLVARNEPPGRLLMETLQDLGSKSQASVVGYAAKLSVDQAALVNGALAHVWEIDDTHRYTMSHPGDSVIPTALAVGEYMGSAATDVLATIVAGYEVAIRVCDAVSPSHLEKGWHPSGTTNTLGAAAAAAKLLGLDAEQTACALGVGVTQAAGTFCHIPERAMTKDLNPGKAAANGILSALLIRKGFTGSPTAIENRKGFIHTHADGGDLGRITRELGASYRIDEIGFKPYACCRHIHAAVEAMLRLRQSQGVKPAEVDSIRVKLYPMADFLTNDPNPYNKGFYGTRYSVQFNLALALVEGESGMNRALLDQDYVSSKLNDQAIRELVGKVHVDVDPALAREWPNKWPAEVTVNLSDARTFSRLVEYPLGEPENPIPYGQLRDKFLRASRGYLGERGTQVLDVVENLEELPDIGALMSLVSGEPRAKGGAS